jgi:protein SCO1/2
MTLSRCIAAAFIFLLAACGQKQSDGAATDVTGALPALDLHMIRANDGRAVTGGDYRGKVAILYFGYTHCPDICPTTLSNLSEVLQRLGPKADGVRVLFVTVDPNRDTAAVMKTYVASFAPQIDGLVGTPDEITALTRRYRVAFKVDPGPPYEVMHSNAVFFFDKTGRARLAAMDVSKTDEIAGDLQRLLRE